MKGYTVVGIDDSCRNEKLQTWGEEGEGRVISSESVLIDQ